MRPIQAQHETFAFRIVDGPGSGSHDSGVDYSDLNSFKLSGRDSDLQEYHNERQRQERALEEETGAYSADVRDHFDRGGKPLITYKDWMKGKRGQGTPTPIDPDFHYTPPADADYEPPW
jgi:hypothetical protein